MSVCYLQNSGNCSIKLRLIVTGQRAATDSGTVQHTGLKMKIFLVLKISSLLTICTGLTRISSSLPNSFILTEHPNPHKISISNMWYKINNSIINLKSLEEKNAAHRFCFSLVIFAFPKHRLILSCVSSLGTGNTPPNTDFYHNK